MQKIQREALTQTQITGGCAKASTSAKASNTTVIYVTVKG
ncbi:hypothetical protein AWB82_00279 [Caballeronia glebae]|jgi:hypothetical protein|uniref:Lipoprotein n=1 Tax=Caballeronia glebae TaxID=1777143 RepID=A0A157Z6K6_9BURK|nr:hypothetical protein AWB82_00279 [Caballeronia glebae]